MDRKYTGINKILWDQGSKFSSLLGSGIKNLRKNTGSATKKYTSLRPCKEATRQKTQKLAIVTLQSHNLFVSQPQQQGKKPVHAYYRHRQQRNST